jgi:hypothetical protein
VSACAFVQFALLNWFSGGSGPVKKAWHSLDKEIVHTRSYGLDTGVPCQPYRRSTSSSMSLLNADEQAYDATLR